MQAQDLYQLVIHAECNDYQEIRNLIHMAEQPVRSVKPILPVSELLNYANPDTGNTALHVACMRHEVELVSILLNAGADVDFPPLGQHERRVQQV